MILREDRSTKRRREDENMRTSPGRTGRGEHEDKKREKKIKIQSITGRRRELKNKVH